MLEEVINKEYNTESGTSANSNVNHIEKFNGETFLFEERAGILPCSMEKDKRCVQGL